MVFAIVNTYTESPVYANLVPRDEDIPSSAPHWRRSVVEHVGKHLQPADHIVTSRVEETEYHVPDDYPHDALAWYVEQVQHWEIVIQTPDLFLDPDDLAVGADHATDYTPPSEALP